MTSVEIPGFTTVDTRSMVLTQNGGKMSSEKRINFLSLFTIYLYTVALIHANLDYSKWKTVEAGREAEYRNGI